MKTDFLASMIVLSHIGSEKFVFAKFGGDKRDRTADPLLAKQVLSQLSYTPISLRAEVPSLQRALKIKQRQVKLDLTLDVEQLSSKLFSSP